jgi:hypothetical protein
MVKYAEPAVDAARAKANPNACLPARHIVWARKVARPLLPKNAEKIPILNDVVQQ